MKSDTTVLIVDDEAHVRRVVEMKLTGAGFHVVAADDGQAGLALAIEHLPAAIVTDYQMPVMSGLEMAEQLRADARTAEIPVVMLTARGFRIGDDELANTNIVELFSKPFSPRQVLGVVQRLIEQERKQAG